MGTGWGRLVPTAATASLAWQTALPKYPRATFRMVSAWSPHDLHIARRPFACVLGEGRDEKWFRKATQIFWGLVEGDGLAVSRVRARGP